MIPETYMLKYGYSILFMELKQNCGLYYLKIATADAVIYYKEGKDFEECSSLVPEELKHLLTIEL